MRSMRPRPPAATASRPPPLRPPYPTAVAAAPPRSTSVLQLERRVVARGLTPPPVAGRPLAPTRRPCVAANGIAARAHALPGARDRQREVHASALGQLALRPDPAAVRLDDALRDVEPEALAPPVVLAHLPEALEDRIEHRRGDSHAGIPDR